MTRCTTNLWVQEIDHSYLLRGILWQRKPDPAMNEFIHVGELPALGGILRRLRIHGRLNGVKLGS